MIPNKVYDILKWICMVFLGAFGTLYQGLSGIWNLPYGPEIADTCYKLAAFLGVCLGISTIQYKSKQHERNNALLEELYVDDDAEIEFDDEDIVAPTDDNDETEEL